MSKIRVSRAVSNEEVEFELVVRLRRHLRDLNSLGYSILERAAKPSRDELEARLRGIAP